MHSILDINSKEIPIISLLRKNLKIELIEENEIGEIYSISALNAFFLSAIVGSNYLINPVGFSLKGRNEVFIHRSVFQEKTYIYSPGLFSRDREGKIIEGNSAQYIQSIFPTLFDEDKKVICINLEKNQRSNIESFVYEKLLKDKKDPKKYIVLKLQQKSGFEPILELLAFIYFKNSGYIFENQAPFFQQNFKYKNNTVSGGIPDISLFKIPEQELMYQKFNINLDTSIPINLIPFLGNKDLALGGFNTCGSIVNHELILGEVKSSISSKKQAITQMKKYSFVDICDDIFGFIPDCSNFDDEGFSCMNVDSEKIRFKKHHTANKNDIFAKEDQNFLETTLKINLLGGLNFKKLNELILDSYGNEVKNGFFSYHLIDFCLRKNFREILGYF